MSYEFNVCAPTKAAALGVAEWSLDEMIKEQPAHAHDKAAALAAAEAFVNLIRDPVEGEMVWIHLSGSLGHWADGECAAATVSVNAYLQRQA